MNVARATHRGQKKKKSSARLPTRHRDVDCAIPRRDRAADFTDRLERECMHLNEKGLNPERHSIHELPKYATRHEAAKRTLEKERKKRRPGSQRECQGIGRVVQLTNDMLVGFR